LAREDARGPAEEVVQCRSGASNNRWSYFFCKGGLFEGQECAALYGLIKLVVVCVARKLDWFTILYC